MHACIHIYFYMYGMVVVSRMLLKHMTSGSVPLCGILVKGHQTIVLGHHRLGRCSYHQITKVGPLDEHDRPKCSDNLYYCFYQAGQLLDKDISIMMWSKLSLIHLHTSLLEEGSMGCKLLRAAFTNKLALKLVKEKKTGLSWEYELLPLVCRQALSSPNHFIIVWMLQGEKWVFLTVALPWYPALWSSQRAVFVETGLFRWLFNSAVTLATIVR